MRLSPTSLTLLALLLAAFLLRAWSPGNMAVEHFDEGVYASNLFSDHLNFRYPDRQFYAPPLLPAIFEWVLILSGSRPHAVMWVNVVLGTALVGAVFWTTRELLNGVCFFEHTPFLPATDPRGCLPVDDDAVRNQAALAAATLITFSDLFIQYSRAALTDVPVCLWMTLAVGAGARALFQGRWGWVVVSGILTALAWWTKYNGWLPLAILGAGGAGWSLLTTSGRASFVPSPGAEAAKVTRKKKRSAPPASTRPGAIPAGFLPLIQWGGIAAVAGLLWLPYLSDLQAHGGYAAVAENHRGYLVGLSGWRNSVRHHLAVDRFYSSVSSAVGVFFALWVAGVIPNAKRVSRPGWGGVISLLILPAALFWTGLIPILCLLTGLAVAAFAMPFPASNGNPPRRSPPLGLWILLAWITGLAVTTPLYRPYPRLILPWMISLSMAAGLGAVLIGRWFAKARTSSTESASGAGNVSGLSDELPVCPIVPGCRWILPVVTVSASIALGFAHPVTRESRTGLQTGARQLLAAIQDDLQHQTRSTVPELDSVLYVIAEPGLYYHLAALEDQQMKYITQPASDLGMLSSGKIDPRVPAYLITALHAKQEADELAALAHAGTTIRKIADIPYVPSALVLLDDFPPATLPQHHSSRLQLWALGTDQQ